MIAFQKISEHRIVEPASPLSSKIIYTYRKIKKLNSHLSLIISHLSFF